MHLMRMYLDEDEIINEIPFLLKIEKNCPQMEGNQLLASYFGLFNVLYLLPSTETYCFTGIILDNN